MAAKAERVYIRYSWDCSCGATGKLRLDPSTTADATEREIEDEHMRVSPHCQKLHYTLTPLENEYVWAGSRIEAA